jgi:hypothetical protein
MGLINKISNSGSQPIKVDSSNTLIDFNLKEVEFLLSLIKDSTFKGSDVESVYNTVLKLQQSYLSYKK